MQRLQDHVICALDVDSADAALDLVGTLRGRLTKFKVGSKLFTRHGPPLIEELAEAGAEIFLDLKYHDIPSVVGAAVAEAADLPGVFLTTIHASGGSEMVARAAEAAGDSLQIVAVTALTSLDAEDVERVAGRSGEDAPAAWAESLGELALEAGADGLVCSAREAAAMRERFGDEPTLVTPGIRLPAGSKGPADDQKRVMTPGRALEDGSDYLVIGRPIYQADDAVAAAEAIARDLG